MRKYRICIQGKNFHVRLDKQILKTGFFTTRFIAAGDSQSAEQRALGMIRKELKKAVLNKRTDPPMLYIKKIVELRSFGRARIPGKGFTWYLEKM